MKQPEDSRTIELNLVNAETKRGRGRPAKDNALTPAQRAKRYRDAKRAAGVPRAPANQHEAKFELDYTRPTWEEMEEVQDALAKMQNKLEAATKTIAALERENALLVDERAKAFKVADQAKTELDRITHMNDNSGKLASEVLKLEAALHQANADHDRMMEDKTAITHQAYGLALKVSELEAKLKKRDASRKKKRQAPGADA